MEWYELLSWILNGCLLIWAVTERFMSMRDKEYIKSSIRVWQHQAQGLANSLETLTRAAGDGIWSSLNSQFTNTKDVGIALDAIHKVAESMHQSLYESRFFTDKELKDNIRKDEQKNEERMSSLLNPPKKKRSRKKVAKSVISSVNN